MTGCAVADRLRPGILGELITEALTNAGHAFIGHPLTQRDVVLQPSLNLPPSLSPIASKEQAMPEHAVPVSLAVKIAELSDTEEVTRQLIGIEHERGRASRTRTVPDRIAHMLRGIQLTEAEVDQILSALALSMPEFISVHLHVGQDEKTDSDEIVGGKGVNPDAAGDPIPAGAYVETPAGRVGIARYRSVGGFRTGVQDVGDPQRIKVWATSDLVLLDRIPT